MTQCAPTGLEGGPPKLDVSAVVCTLNSESSIEACLRSLRDNHVKEIIVVDGGSSDRTVEIARSLSDHLCFDDGVGLGAARNAGIMLSTGAFVLNAGSDNVFPEGSVASMIHCLNQSGAAGVSAQTRVPGSSYLARAQDLHRRGRFQVGPAAVIGTPTLFLGQLLRSEQYSPNARFSDDSEICERLASIYGAKFFISEAEVLEVGKSKYYDVVSRCKMYGVSDAEVRKRGVQSGWSRRRRLKSLAHPFRVEVVHPVSRLNIGEALLVLPFAVLACLGRYLAWTAAEVKRARSRLDTG